ncbi:hypothetical protein D3C86_1810250 [compost metagenome]
MNIKAFHHVFGIAGQKHNLYVSVWQGTDLPGRFKSANAVHFDVQDQQVIGVLSLHCFIVLKELFAGRKIMDIK